MGVLGLILSFVPYILLLFNHIYIGLAISAVAVVISFVTLIKSEKLVKQGKNKRINICAVIGAVISTLAFFTLMIVVGLYLITNNDPISQNSRKNKVKIEFENYLEKKYNEEFDIGDIEEFHGNDPFGTIYKFEATAESKNNPNKKFKIVKYASKNIIEDYNLALNDNIQNHIKTILDKYFINYYLIVDSNVKDSNTIFMNVYFGSDSNYNYKKEQEDVLYREILEKIKNQYYGKYEAFNIRVYKIKNRKIEQIENGNHSINDNNYDFLYLYSNTGITRIEN